MARNVTQIRVKWGETDTARIIYYPNYFHWFDQATHELFRALGMPVAELDRLGFAFPILEGGAKFFQPLVYDDLVNLETEVTEVNNKTFRLVHYVKKDEIPVAEGFEVRAWTKYPEPGSGDRMRAVPIPEEYANRLRE